MHAKVWSHCCMQIYHESILSDTQESNTNMYSALGSMPIDTKQETYTLFY